MTTTLEQARVTCTHCGALVNARGGREVIGWEQVREQGGLHALIARTETGRWACADCLRKIRQGVPPGQMELHL